MSKPKANASMTAAVRTIFDHLNALKLRVGSNSLRVTTDECNDIIGACDALATMARGIRSMAEADQRFCSAEHALAYVYAPEDDNAPTIENLVASEPYSFTVSNGQSHD